MRVLFVNMESSIGGAEQSLLLLVRFLRDRNVQVSAVCPSGTLSQKLRNLNVRTFKLAAWPKRPNLQIALLYSIILANIQLFLAAVKSKPHVIHANSTKAVLASILTKCLMRIPLVWHVRDMGHSWFLANLCKILSSQIIAVSCSVKQLLVARGIKAEHIEVVYNGLAVDNLPNTHIPADEYLTFANIGQFVPWKNQILFIDAAQRLLRQGCKAKFILIGDDIFGRDKKYKNTIYRRVEASPYRIHFKIMGWQDDLELCWPKIDCLVHTAQKEPFGRVIIEAMAHKVPVIAAASGGPIEIVQNNVTGLLFVPDDIDSLVANMERVSDQALRIMLAENAAQHVLKNFRAEQTASSVLKIYERLCAA